MKDYKRDTVRGKSPRIDPIEYKPDTLVQTWIDARKLVMLDNWLAGNHIYTRFMADIVREVLDIVIDQLLDAGEVKKVEFSTDAANILKAKFNKKSLNPGNRGKRNILHNLTLDDRRRGKMIRMEESDYSCNYSSGELISDVPEDIHERNNRLWEEAQKKIREEEIKEAKEAIASRLTFDENGVAIIPKSEGMYTAEDRKREIAETRKRLGLDQHSPPNEVSYNQPKKHLKNKSQDEDSDSENVTTPESIARNSTIAKLSEDELRRKEEAIAKRDRELEKQLSCLPDDLTPIEE